MPEERNAVKFLQIMRDLDAAPEVLRMTTYDLWKKIEFIFAKSDK